MQIWQIVYVYYEIHLYLSDVPNASITDLHRFNKKKKAELFEQGLSIEGFRFIDQ